MLLNHKHQRVDADVSRQFLAMEVFAPSLPQRRLLGDHSNLTAGWTSTRIDHPFSGETDSTNTAPVVQPSAEAQPGQIDPLYLFARYLEWEEEEEPSAAWDLVAAARSSNSETRAHARALLASSRHLGSRLGSGCTSIQKRSSAMETDMKAPYGLDIIENCTECTNVNPGFFCGFSYPTLEALSQVSQKTILPAGAILFVEGQTPRGMFSLCSGKVNLSTSSHHGKTLILKTASAGEALGVSASISGMGYEATAEASTPCQLNFVDRKSFLELMQSHSEVGMQTAQCLCRDFRSAHRDIHDLVLTRSSSGKLARLLLSQSPSGRAEDSEIRIHTVMTHEEMAQRIGASRETVTRLLGDLKRKQLIRQDGPILVIRDRIGLEALAG